MAHRKQNIRTTMKNELKKQDVSSNPDKRNKHSDKIKTKNARRQAKSEGKTLRERDEINFSKNRIYSHSTMDTYIREADNYADWLEKNGMKKVSLKVAKSHIQNYMNYLSDKGYSAASIHTKLAACCKIFGTYMRDYNIPQRSVADIQRGRNEVKNDKYNEKNHGDLLEINRLVGVRKTELANIKAKDVEILPDRTIIHTIGKGGKRNQQVFFDTAEREKISGWLHGKQPDDYLFDRERILKTDCDFHSERANRAKDVYNKVVKDIQNNPDRQKWYEDFISKEMAKTGRKIKNLDKPYICRGKFRNKLISENKPYIYNRTAVMFVSITVLNHWRCDTSVQHYISV